MGIFSFNWLNSNEQNKDKKIIKPTQKKSTNRQKQSSITWRDSIVQAENPYYPLRWKMQELYLDTILNSQVIACIERRKDLTLLRDWEFVKPSGTVDKNTNELMNTLWFRNFISYSLDAIFFGYSMINLGSIINNEFPNIQITRRDFVSTDYNLILNNSSVLDGTDVTDPKYYNWNILVKTTQPTGVNNCGYGLLYPVGILEVYLRNLLGLNADNIELFTQPFRVGKTDKTNEEERDFFENMLADFGSNSWALIDPEDSIEFLQTNNGGNTYDAYSNFEKRLEDKVAKIILGHADALDSTPGKLGATSGEDNPISEALKDKRNIDAAFIETLVNEELLPRMNALGFNIKSKFQFRNDDEEFESIKQLTELAGNMSKAGLQIDPEYFMQKTKIPVVTSIPEPTAEPQSQEQQKEKQQKNVNKE